MAFMLIIKNNHPMNITYEKKEPQLFDRCIKKGIQLDALVHMHCMIISCQEHQNVS